MKSRYKTIVDNFARTIRCGELAAGSRLPTHRRLAADEHISLATATRVYAELEAMGLVSGETGRGTFVREIALPAGHGVDQPAVAADVRDLNFNYPTLAGQGDTLRDALRELAASGDIESHLRYQPHAGRFSDREVMAGYLSGHGFSPKPENILIVNGAQHGLTVSVMGLLRPGDVVAVDALTYSGFKALAELYHLELIALPVRQEGPDLETLAHLCSYRAVRAVYTMPTLHNPLGWVLTSAQRQRLVDIARQHDLLILEDAAYSYLVHRPPPPLASMAPERTVYITGLSKNVATGLRVGMVVCPETFKAALERAIRATAWNTPSLITALVCGWIKDGTVSRLETLKRHDAQLRQTLARECLSGLPYIGHPDAYFLWLPLADESRADRVANMLMDKNISVSTSEPFCVSVNMPQAIRIALGTVAMSDLQDALLTVRSVIEFEQYGR
ncbi:PLP-dependent aminotransferase family protein [Kluyvera genomosp. 1]|uniref:aminotransferase-like domain-containing protein n=1 Tax=Kluyvera genomosp. 1 TaxID=2774053 RepID=UPI00068EFD42|nr:PLP-dependent aminotransferase family protein [Kluyvera genomosp. 1]